MGMLFRTATISENQRGLLIRDGRFVNILNPGRFRFFDPGKRYNVELFNVVKTELTSEWGTVLEKSRPELAAKLFNIVRTGDGQIGIVSLDGIPSHVVPPWSTRYFWKVMTRVDVEYIDTNKELRISPDHLHQIAPLASRLRLDEVLNQNETGLLFVDGGLAATLKPGRHAFWQVNRTVAIRRYSSLPQLLEVTAQEIMTRDRVSLRVTLSAYAKITNPVKAYEKLSDNIETYLYRLVQFAIREAIAARTLDEVLNDQDQIDKQLRTSVEASLGDVGVELHDLGIKDVILPGDMRMLINKVVEAEKTAQANLIRRREETAATRSLLNTARLMENNPVLMRLKEIEALEKLVEKVGKIDLHAGTENAGLDALLTKMLNTGPVQALTPPAEDETS